MISTENSKFVNQKAVPIYTFLHLACTIFIELRTFADSADAVFDPKIQVMDASGNKMSKYNLTQSTFFAMMRDSIIGNVL